MRPHHPYQEYESLSGIFLAGRKDTGQAVSIPHNYGIPTDRYQRAPEPPGFHESAMFLPNGFCSQQAGKENLCVPET